MFVLCSLTFHTGKLSALRAADKLALVAACVDRDELAALRNVTEDRVVRLEHLHGLLHALNQVLIQTRSQITYVDSEPEATIWGPLIPILEAGVHFLVQAMLAPRVSTSELHHVICWVDLVANLALHSIWSASFTGGGVDVSGNVAEPSM